MGVGLVGSVIVGHTLKELGKLILFLIEVFIAMLVHLSKQSVINVSYGGLWSALSGFIGWAGSAFSGLVTVTSLLPFAASIIVELLLGLKLA